MKRRFSSADEGTDEINISPLIDMVFILLIFFIVTTVFVEETGIEVNKPDATDVNDLEKNSILIAINDEGKVYYGGKEVGVSGIRSIVKRLTAKDKDIPVIIQADRASTMEVFAKVSDEAKLAGAQIINLSTAK